MAITAMSLTNGTLILVVDNGAEILIARNDHPKWTEIIAAFKVEDEARLRALIPLKSVVEDYTVGLLSINASGVTYQGNPIHTVDAERVMAFLRDGLPYQPIANYIERKMKNPSERAIQKMYGFLEHKGMPLTPRGTFIAYKGVQPDFYSIQGNKDTKVIRGTVNEQGQILNFVGETIEVERASVDDNHLMACSTGLHAGSLSYAKGWGQRVILVEIDPADVVSVPSDCNCQKLRCCKYKVIGEYTGPMPDTYTDEFTPTKDADADEDNICHQCGAEKENCDCDDECDGCGEHPDNCTCDDVCETCGEHVDDCPCNSTDVTKDEPQSPPETPISINLDKAASRMKVMDAWLQSHTKPEPPTANPDECPVCKYDKFACTCAPGGCGNVTIDPAPASSMSIIGVRLANIYNRWVELVSEMFSADKYKMDLNTTLQEFTPDSLDYVEICMAAEEEFGIDIPDVDGEKYVSLPFSEIIKYIDNRLQCQKQYTDGFDAGLQDRIAHRLPKYFLKDDEGADSDADRMYIIGYLAGI